VATWLLPTFSANLAQSQSQPYKTALIHVDPHPPV